MKPFFSRWDFLLIALVVLGCSLAILWPKGENETPIAQVTVDGILVHSVDLSRVTKAYDLPLDTSPSVVLRVEPGRICYLEADCPDHLCVHTGWLEQAGDTAACLPSRTLVTVSGQSDIILTH